LSSILWREVVEAIARRGVSALLGERRQSRFPSVRHRPLGHLSVFRINNLRAMTDVLSHTPPTMRALSSILFVFSGLAPTDGNRRQELCKTCECRPITYGHAQLPEDLSAARTVGAI
jgi:hypothetical protein